MRKLALIMAVFGLGIVLGPLLFALASGATASSDDSTRWRQAYALLAAFDEQSPQVSMHGGDWEPDIEDCGYSRETVYDSDDDLMALERRARGVPYRDVSWSPYSGHFRLHAWRSDQFGRPVQDLRAEFLRNRFGPFAAAFLDQCMRHSLAASICASRVEVALEEANLRSPKSGPTGRSAYLSGDRETQVICTYLDGLAARNGHPLAQRRIRR